MAIRRLQLVTTRKERVLPQDSTRDIATNLARSSTPAEWQVNKRRRKTGVGLPPALVVGGHTLTVAHQGIFLARADEISRFSAALAEFGSGWRGEGWPTVVLIHGLGGIGKSSLMRRLQQMVDERDAVAVVDFEEARKLHPAAFGGDAGPGLTTMLDVVMWECIDAMAKHRDRQIAQRAFDGYRTAVAQLPQLLERIRAGMAEAEQTGLAKEDIVALEKSALAVGTLIGHQPLAIPATASAASAVGQAALAKRGFWRRLTGAPTVEPDDYDLMSDPPRALARRFGQGLATLSAHRPLVLFLDTSEIVLAQMPWLREAMRSSGERVLWVIGARLEPEQTADADSEVAAFIRQVPSDRLRLMALTRFDDQTVRQYLARRLPDVGLDADDVARVSGFTKGLPLAVSLVADLLAKGATLDGACAEVDRPKDALAPITPGQVVAVLARRFLVHTERLTDLQSRQDLHHISCLAVANGYPTRNPEVLRSMLDTKGDLFELLRTLASRHDFVLSDSFRLHDDVRDTLRADLMDPVRRTRIKAPCQRAVEVLANDLTEQRSLLPTLRDQLGSERYIATLLDYVWYSCWMQAESGWKSALTVLPLLAVANVSAADSLLATVEWFVAWGAADERRLFDELAAAKKPSFPNEWLTKRNVVQRSGIRLGVQITRDGYNRLARVEPIDGLLGSDADRLAALSLIDIRLMIADEDAEARRPATVEQLRRLGSDADPALASSVAETLMSFVEPALRGDTSEVPVPDLTLAADALTAAHHLVRQAAWKFGSLALAWHRRSGAPAKDLAEAMYQRALEAGSGHANTLGNYANFLTDVRGEHDAAEAMYQRALEADPGHANALGNFARLLFILDRDGEGERLARRALGLAIAGEEPLRAECFFYLFMHVSARRSESGSALKGLLARGVATGAWDFTGNLQRVCRERDPRLEFLTAVAEALRDGTPQGLDRFEEWCDLGDPGIAN